MDFDVELTEAQAQRVLDYSHGIAPIVGQGTALAIAMAIACHTVANGESRISHKTFQQRTGKCRRTVDTALKLLKRHDVIKRVGTQESGVAVYIVPAVK